jgi:hypothetical protein
MPLEKVAAADRRCGRGALISQRCLDGLESKSTSDIYAMLELGFIANSAVRSRDVSRDLRNGPVNIVRESELIRVSRQAHVTFRQAT